MEVAAIIKEIKDLQEEIRLDAIYCVDCCGDCLNCSRYLKLDAAIKLLEKIKD